MVQEDKVGFGAPVMTYQPIRVEVQCHAGYRGEQTPRRFSLGLRTIEVEEVVDAWLAPDHRYFKLRSRDGGVYILRHDVVLDYWEVTLFESPLS